MFSGDRRPPRLSALSRRRRYSVEKEDVTRERRLDPRCQATGHGGSDCRVVAAAAAECAASAAEYAPRVRARESLARAGDGRSLWSARRLGGLASGGGDRHRDDAVLCRLQPAMLHHSEGEAPSMSPRFGARGPAGLGFPRCQMVTFCGLGSSRALA
ncbi:hypothetical protein ISCGN_033036, partial [Ixodes scapularis]